MLCERGNRMTREEIVTIVGEDQDIDTIESIVGEETSKSQRMRELYELEPHLSLKEIGALLGTSYNHAYNVLKATHGEVRKQREGSTKTEKYREMWNEGFSVGEIAKELNDNYNQVWKAINEYRNEKGE